MQLFRLKFKTPLLVAFLIGGFLLLALTLRGVSAKKTEPPLGMKLIPAGEFWMGCSSTPADNEEKPDPSLADCSPSHKVKLDAFWMDEHEVSNAEFELFVKETAYVTEAEIAPDPNDYPGVPLEKLQAGSAIMCHTKEGKKASLNDPYSWWEYKIGSSWRHPEGPGSSIEGKGDFPVVHITWRDATAYAHWIGKRLPTEAEFEYAARGGLDRKRYVWGDELHPQKRFMANVWQGIFPEKNSGEDGYQTSAPIKSFPPNGYGLFDMAGNVWEWTSDWYRPDTYKLAKSSSIRVNPQGPDSSYDPDDVGTPKKVQRGGSFLCAENYCTRYLVASRGKGDIHAAAFHLGFRLVKSVK